MGSDDVVAGARMGVMHHRPPGVMPRRQVLAVLPSWGLGGGIERYVAWLFEALEGSGATIRRETMIESIESASISPLTKIRFARRLFRTMRGVRDDTFLVVLHPGLGVLSLLMARLARRSFPRSLVFFYGQDVWEISRWELRVMEKMNVQFVGISDFWAGALANWGNAVLAPPGLSKEWFAQLVSARASHVSSPDGTLRLLTVFRLEGAIDKGLPEILDAIDFLRDRGYPISLTVAGSGILPPGLEIQLNSRPWVTVLRDLSDDELATLYSRSDAFVLATRMRRRPEPLGEGFGLVLGEAQLAGLPVVIPAFGGSASSFVKNVTGIRPIDESVGALVQQIERLCDPEFRRAMATNAAEWSLKRFDPVVCESCACEVIFGLE